ncbi:MAG: hypothetical protein R3E31_12970 [Chloroflexota bacterium]
MLPTVDVMPGKRTEVGVEVAAAFAQVAANLVEGNGLSPSVGVALV